MKRSTFIVLNLFVFCGWIIYVLSSHIIKNPEVNHSTDTVIIQKLIMPIDPKEDLFDVMEYYNIKHPEIVYAQAILETGHFTSYNCKVNNNLFGLYDSRNKRFFKFNHWTESVRAYKDMIQYKYKGGDYYEFLDSIGYAEDSEYLNKVKRIVKKWI